MAATALILVLAAAGLEAEPYAGEAIFSPQKLHNHSSCIVQCPNGDLLVCWYRGSGERKADDVAILGARKRAGSPAWSEPFVLADHPGFPDTNPCMLIDPRRRLWLFWPVILANEWHTALLQSKVASRYEDDGPPHWEEEKPVLLKPGPEFAAELERSIRDTGLEGAPRLNEAKVTAWLAQVRGMAGDKLSTRLGWMPRPHPIVLGGSRLLLPLYSDGFDFSLMAFTDDWGKNWEVGAPLVGGGNVQPSVVVKKDGTLAAYMRDNGLPPKRALYSESRDRGKTWSRVRDTDILNPGSGLEVIALKDGLWALVNNDTERGRHTLSVWLSADEGATWAWKRRLEPRGAEEGGLSASYPSIIQAADGALHASYSRSAGGGETIFHARFTVEWVKMGEAKEGKL